jgi:hypothetical protein
MTPPEPSLTEIRDSLAALERNSAPLCNRSAIAHVALFAVAFLAGALFVTTRPLPPITAGIDAAGETLPAPPSAEPGAESHRALDASLAELAVTIPLCASVGALVLALGFSRWRAAHHGVHP